MGPDMAWWLRRVIAERSQGPAWEEARAANWEGNCGCCSMWLVAGRAPRGEG